MPVVRSEGGEDVSSFNGLPGWVKRLGAVRAHRCFSSQHQMLRCRLRLRCGSPAAALCCARLQPGMRVLGVADGSGAASLAAVRLVAKGCRHFSSVWGSTQASAVERVHCTALRRRKTVPSRPFICAPVTQMTECPAGIRDNEGHCSLEHQADGDRR
jgi:hypothetical protein